MSRENGVGGLVLRAVLPWAVGSPTDMVLGTRCGGGDMRWIAGLGCVVSLSIAACSAGPVEVTEETFVAWAEDRAVVLDAKDWPNTDPSALEVLDELIDEARVVFLGEPDHYIAEKYDYRLVMIRYLIERGYNYIGMEMGLSDGMRVDRYLETGDPAELNRVALYGYRGDMRADRDDLPGSFAAFANREFSDAFIRAEVEFLSMLRVVSESLPDRLRWFGFDVDIYPGGGYADLGSVLAPYTADELIRQLETASSRVPGESRPEEIERLEALESYVSDRLPELVETIGADRAGQVRQILRNLVESLRFRDLAFREPFGQYWAEGLAYREAAIIGRLDDGWLVQLPDDAKVILMGHNFHLSKEGINLSFGSVAEAVPSPLPVSFGSGVADRVTARSIWMLYDHGTSANSLLDPPYFDVPSHSDRIEHLLAGVAPVFVLPLVDDDPRSAWLDQDLNFVQNGDYGSGLLRMQADIVFFVEEVHAVGR